MSSRRGDEFPEVAVPWSNREGHSCHSVTGPRTASSSPRALRGRLSGGNTFGSHGNGSAPPQWPSHFLRDVLDAQAMLHLAQLVLLAVCAVGANARTYFPAPGGPVLCSYGCAPIAGCTELLNCTAGVTGAGPCCVSFLTPKFVALTSFALASATLSSLHAPLTAQPASATP